MTTSRRLEFCFAVVLSCLPLSSQTPDRFTERLHRLSEKLDLPGFSVAIVRDGEIIYRHSEGFASLDQKTPIALDSLFGIASVTKSMTGAMLMQMEAEGKVQLSDRLLSYPLNTGWHPPAGIGDPNITIGDALSMSAGGHPGKTYVYNGARFNLLSGVFDKVSAMESPQSYVVQVQRRVLDPLRMTSTMAGFPKTPTSLSLKAVKRYQAMPSTAGWKYKEMPYDWDAAYPAAGLISTIDDMAKFAAALDRNTLVTSTQYAKMTAPVHGHPYGYGWFTQTYEGEKIDWVFGYGQAESALFLRVPGRHLTFIFLSNADTPSALAQLDYANVLRQPFGLVFLDAFVGSNEGASIDFDRSQVALRRTIGPRCSLPIVEMLVDEALLEAFRQKLTRDGGKRSIELAELIADVSPSRFLLPDVYMLRLLSETQSPKLAQPTRHLLTAFNLDIDDRPVAAFWSGNTWEKLGDQKAAMKDYRLLCDRTGFDDESMKAQACERLGQFELSHGDEASGRRHVWHSGLISRNANESQEFDRKLRIVGEPIK